MDEHTFSIQLKSKDYLKGVALPNDEEGNVLIEGFLGKLENVNFIEGIMLEINGGNRSLRIDLNERVLKGLAPERPTLRKNLAKETRRERKQGFRCKSCS